MVRKISTPQSEPLDWESIVTQALSLEGAERATHYGKPAVKVNGRTFLSTGREVGSFALHIDAETKQLLIDHNSRTYWQTSHYEGWPTVLVRYDTPDSEHVFGMVYRAWQQALANGAPSSERNSHSAKPKRKPR